MLSNNCDSIPDIGGIISGGVVVDPEGELSGNALRVTLTLVVLLTLTLNTGSESATTLAAQHWYQL